MTSRVITLALCYEELVATHLIGHGEELLKQLDDDVLRRVALLFIAMRKHLATCIEQEQTEESQHPFKLLDHSRAGKDKDAAQHQGSEDTPEQHLVLIFAVDAEEREEHEEHEEVVHRQRLFYQIACEEFHGFLVGIHRIEEVDAGTEHQRDAYPDACHFQRLFDTDLMLAFLAEHLQVGNQHDKHQYVEQNPRPKG